MGFLGSGFIISVGFNVVDGEGVKWQELQSRPLHECEMFNGKQEPFTVRVARGVVHHVVIDEVAGSFGNMNVSLKTLKRVVSCKSKSKQPRRVWVNQSTPQTQAPAP